MPTSGRHILIVDDNKRNLQLTASSLRDEGYLISVAQNAKAALSELNDLIPDLILLDIMMPDIDGLELCRIIKQNEKMKEIPVIFLTAKSHTEDLAEGFRAGGVDYIIKPYNREELLIRVKNHIELASSRKQIIEMNLMRDKMYSIIAHDIRSPFSSISLTLTAIASGHLDTGTEDFREIMSHLEKTANDTSSLLDNLLEFTRLQSRIISMTPRNAALYPILIEATELLKPNADKKNIVLSADIPDDLYAFFDEKSMYSVFRNLITNSIKFTHGNGKIDIKAVIEEDFAVVSVTDTGIGMPEELIRKIFIENEHFTSPGTNQEHGSGLGTYIIKDFVSRNNGKLKISSIPGSGTEVLVYIPLKPDKGE